MPYFADHYQDVSYPLPTAANPEGLYNAQLGAIHALASHFTVHEQPAIVAMPTGSGKTAVLMMLPFILKSTRALVITPSRLVRGQIAEDFANLRTLRDVGVLPNDIALPRVMELETRIASPDDWEALRDYDVVVSTPNCTSPGHEGIPPPPPDLFDVLIIDEAHHTAANTWVALLATLKTTRRALFTATPFRRDRGEIPGRFAYNYPIARAFADHIFGRIAYVQVIPAEGETNDIAIARRTAEVFANDRQAGLNHYVMVRTDRKSRADELGEVYRNHTHLRLKVVHSGLSNRTVKHVLCDLEHGELDGVICVNMMGEGFNFPRLKIAAVHSPHRSLEVTLQFIGRFARTNASDIGEAKFLAVLSEIEIERRRLFDEGAVWQEIIPELSYGRIANEIRVREGIEEFQNPIGTDEDFTDLSLYSLYPRSHVKVYDVPDRVDLRQTEVEVEDGREVCYRNTSADGTVLILITRELATPKWSAGDKLVNVGYNLVIVFYDAETHLLFINSSRRSEGMYKNVAAAVSEHATPIPTNQVRRVVKEITNKRIFNIGMRNIQAANTRESYKIVAASDAQIDPADARRYRQGHVFLSGDSAGERTTIGYSSGAKIWSSTNNQIPDLLDWCKTLARKIRSTGAVVTHSGLDFLDAGEVVTAIPEHLIYVQWPKDAFDYTDPVQVEYRTDDGRLVRRHILDLDLRLDREKTNRDRIRVIVSADGLDVPIDFTLNEFYAPVGQPEDRVGVVQGTNATSLIDYLNASPLDFYTANGSLFSGNELFEPKEDARPITDNQFTAWEWGTVDIEQEITPRAGFQSVHQKVRTELEQGNAAIIFYDHGSGEVADYLTVTEDGDATRFVLYHCKGSGGPAPGARVDDVYEVSGQAQKSVAWASLARLEQRIRSRIQQPRFVRGTGVLLQELLIRARDRRQQFEIKIVQPGISKARLSAPMAECLGATNGYLVGLGIAPLEVIVSA